jgi:mannose-6-phosphate isomerase-like protein (cupin superfamily)
MLSDWFNPEEDLTSVFFLSKLCPRCRIIAGISDLALLYLSFHNGAHDSWLVLKGSVRLWAGEQSRILYPGDFAYVPPVSFLEPSKPCL